ncbi:MAG: hypothetical protein ACNYPD_01325 [Candidatus Halichondribacter symbioticus]
MKHLTILACILTSIILTACGSGAGSNQKNDVTNASRNYTPMENIVEITDLPDYSTLSDTVAGLDGLNRGFLFGTSDNSLNTEGISNPALAYGRRNIDEESDGYNDGYVFTNFGSHVVAAILPTTNLGAPLPVGQGQPIEVEWAGNYSLSSIAANIPFNILINFATGKLVGEDPSSSYSRFILDGSFDSRGILTGSFMATNSAGRNRSITGPVTGLIGEQGIVGILHGENSLAGRDDNLGTPAFVAGGFVADNPSNSD